VREPVLDQAQEPVLDQVLEVEFLLQVLQHYFS
jgi:hypothetical protein